MSEKPTTIQLAYRVTPERRRQLKQLALEHDTTIQGVLDEALELLLNPAAESTEKILDGQRKLVAVRNTLVHNYPIEDWQRWAEMVLISDNFGAVTGLAVNIQGFLYKLMANKDKTSGLAHAISSTTTPDYAAEAERAEEALEFLRRYFEGKRKRVRPIPHK